ncbi:MAG: FHA domain-containing protein [Myxococcales bacterium]|nr:FHA domain-containing protein [Myxococcales bacterium]
MSLAVQIAIHDPRSRSRHEETFQRFPVRIGRHDLNDCLVDASDASRFHARLQVAADGVGLELVDVGSRNGTFVGDERLRVDEPRRLVSGPDAFRIGRLRFGVRTGPSIQHVRPSLVPNTDLDPFRAALLVLRRLSDLYVPSSARLKTAEDVLAFGGRLRDALDALGTHYALSPRPARSPSPLHVLQGLLDARQCAARLYDVDSDLADAHLREQRLVRGFEEGLGLLLGHAGVSVDDYLRAHGDSFGAELMQLRERLDEDETPEEAVA